MSESTMVTVGRDVHAGLVRWLRCAGTSCSTSGRSPTTTVRWSGRCGAGRGCAAARRAREDTRIERMHAPHRLSKLLVRNDRRLPTTIWARPAAAGCHSTRQAAAAGRPGTGRWPPGCRSTGSNSRWTGLRGSGQGDLEPVTGVCRHCSGASPSSSTGSDMLRVKPWLELPSWRTPSGRRCCHAIAVLQCPTIDPSAALQGSKHGRVHPSDGLAS
jgi:hypothetical protein